MINMFFSLPDVLRNEIYMYDPEHREKMKAVLKEIQTNSKCEVCDRVILKYVYSSRNGDEICCSEECLDSWIEYLF